MLSSVKSLLKYRLPKILKFFFVLLMCLMIIISPCILRPVKVKAAMTGTAVVAGGVAVAAIAAALGITVVASNPTARANVNNKFQTIYENNKTMVDGLIASGTVLADNSGKVLKCSADNLMTIFRTLQAQFTQTSGIAFSNTADVIDWLGLRGANTNQIRGLEKYQGLSIVGSSTIPIIKKFHGDEYFTISLGGQFIVDVQFGGYGHYALCYGKTLLDYCECRITNDCCDLPVKLMYYTSVKDGAQTPGYVFIYPYVDVNYGLIYDYGEISLAELTGEASQPLTLGQDLFNPATDKFIADGFSAMANKIGDVIDKLKEKVGDIDGNIGVTVPADVIGSDTVGDLTQKKVVGKTIADTQDKTKDVTINKSHNVPTSKSEDTTKSGRGMPVLPTSISRKFPFSIPWDLYNAISILKYPGQAPKFTVHFGKASYVMDMAMFDPVATVVRWGLSLLFLIALIVLTGRVIKH